MNEPDMTPAALAILAQKALDEFCMTRFPLGGDLFPFGQIAMNPKAREELCNIQLLQALADHGRGQYREVACNRGQETDQPVDDSDTIISECRNRGGGRFFIITMLDRSLTVVFVPG